jgi:mannose-6-phosphate isomerase-like protein (cupin superfamily)
MRLPVETDTGSGEQLRLLGVERDEKGEHLILEGFVQRGAGPPMHVHLLQDEGIRVVVGRLGYMVRSPDGEDRKGSVGAGEEVVFRAGEIHRFWNHGEVPTRFADWVHPPGTFAWFITRLHASIRENGGERPAFLEGAYLSWRYRREFELEEIPGFVKRAVFPLVVVLGTLLGRYGKYRDAPPSPPPPPTGHVGMAGGRNAYG